MIVTTTKTINGRDYMYTYSDAHMYIERNGLQYINALDPLNSGRVYTETDVPIDDGADEAKAEELLGIILGEGPSQAQEDNGIGGEGQ